MLFSYAWMNKYGSHVCVLKLIITCNFKIILQSFYFSISWWLSCIPHGDLWKDLCPASVLWLSWDRTPPKFLNIADLVDPGWSCKRLPTKRRATSWLCWCFLFCQRWLRATEKVPGRCATKFSFPFLTRPVIFKNRSKSVSTLLFRILRGCFFKKAQGPLFDFDLVLPKDVVIPDVPAISPADILLRRVERVLAPPSWFGL